MRKSDHISAALQHLHWLPVRYRIEYKIALLTYKALNDKGPQYLRKLLDETPSTRVTRSKDRLKIRRTKLKSAGDRSYSVAAPSIWNSLPPHIANLSSIACSKKLLKTHYFKKAYFSQ